MTKSIIKNIVKAVLVIIVVFAACSYVWNKTKTYYEENPIILETVVEKTVQCEPEIIEKEITISGATIDEGLNEIGILNTAEYYFTHVGKYSENKTIWGYDVPFSESSYIYSYDGRVCAGMDFAAIEVDVDQNYRTITLTLPQVEITGFEIESDSFVLYEEDISLINRLSVETMADSITSMEEEERKNAVEKGILDTAERNAELLVRNFLNGLYEVNGYSVVILHNESPQTA